MVQFLYDLLCLLFKLIYTYLQIVLLCFIKHIFGGFVQNSFGRLTF